VSLSLKLLAWLAWDALKVRNMGNSASIRYVELVSNSEVGFFREASKMCMGIVLKTHCAEFCSRAAC